MWLFLDILIILLAFNPWKIHGGHMQRPWMETEGWRQEVVGNEQKIHFPNIVIYLTSLSDGITGSVAC